MSGRLQSVVLSLLAFVLLLGACSRNRDGLSVVGSTSVQPFAEALAEEYMTAHREKIFVQGGGSSAGIQAVKTGAAQVGMSSRPLLAEEKSLLAVPIIYDAIAVIVNRENNVEELSTDQVRKIFSGEITRWSQVGGREKPITLVSREDGSGTREAFQNLIMGKNIMVSPSALVQDSNGAIRQVVGDDPNAIGYISLGLVDKRVKALRIDGVEATVDNVRRKTYRFVRPFLFVFRSEPSGTAKEFLAYILSPGGQKILVQEGLVSMSPSPPEEGGAG
ncbi:MAG TPA: phosphate ABC transporter substrate-binding protein [Thermodesulfobacteriota bacterium]|nr:phosphate ABC transporter substrate-binding protein [Thermodesulfobacteriota bacterium]